MDRKRNIELDRELVKATYLVEWENEVLNILSEYFPGHDCDCLKMLFYTKWSVPDSNVKEITLVVDLKGTDSTFGFKPSTMTDFEFGTFCFCVERRYRSGTIKTILELLEHAVLKQPLEVPIDKYKKHINILAEGIQKQNWKGCSISFGNKKNETDITLEIVDCQGVLFRKQRTKTKRKLPSFLFAEEIKSKLFRNNEEFKRLRHTC